MSILLTVFLLASQQPKPLPISLTFFEDSFVVRQGDDKEIAPLRMPPEPKKLVAPYRKNNTFVVWDERGLAIRHNDKLKTTKFEALPTSPKAFNKAEIKQNIKRIASGDISRSAAALSGSQRIGNDIFFLARWEDRHGAPWLEGLFKVDLTADQPTPKFVARARAISTAQGAIDQQLFIFGGKLAYIAGRADRWGMVMLAENAKLQFKTYGYRLDSLIRFGNTGAFFIEHASYGTTIAGRVDFRSGERLIYTEGRENVKFVDRNQPDHVVVSTRRGPVLRSAFSGMDYPLPASSAMRKTSRGVIVWTPVSSPKKAWLLEPERWSVLAAWQRKD